MNCVEVRQAVQDYVTRELSIENRRLFDAHLVECGECQRELALMTALVSTLDHQPVLEPRPGFGEKVLSSLPRQRSLVLNPWWSLALAPVLGGLAWLFRVRLERVILGLAGQLGIRSISLPALTMQNAGIVAAAVVGVGLLVTAGGAWFCWRVYLQE
ncbi:zf-HC2 domain-containing protein [candidate division WOR-3 bacterium]|uniref:Zf-HC2 domain-containing protein n=1 Tax=candidate division WOR-3 bacterium TaxID=2052148 RepID=A0A937XB47_UNCW3|nr:zf-HC2 domain-containing protein [candidate division WOR-3 bacterium]